MIGDSKWERTMSENLSSFDEMKVQLWHRKYNNVSPPATAGCGPFINDSCSELQLQEHFSFSFLFLFFFFICKRNQKRRDDISHGSTRAERRLKVMCQFRRILYHRAISLSHEARPWRIFRHVFVFVYASKGFLITSYRNTSDFRGSRYYTRQQGSDHDY